MKKPKALYPAPPRRLSRGAVAVWRRIAPQISFRGKDDRGALSAFCAHKANAVAIRRRIEKLRAMTSEIESLEGAEHIVAGQISDLLSGVRSELAEQLRSASAAFANQTANELPATGDYRK
jgi:hypothetical protein